MCHGWHRRNAEAWRRTRQLSVILLNVNRGPDDEAYVAEEWQPLYGDTPRALPAPLTPAQIEEEFARVSALDADLL